MRSWGETAFNKTPVVWQKVTSMNGGTGWINGLCTVFCRTAYQELFARTAIGQENNIVVVAFHGRVSWQTH
jgi:hypothetical protein